MYIKVKILVVSCLTGLLLVACPQVTAYAANHYAVDNTAPDTVPSSTKLSFWERAKEAGSAAADYADTHKDGWITAAKDGAAELYGTAQDGLNTASNTFAEFRQNQEDQFWDRFASQTGAASANSGNTGEQTTPDENSAATRSVTNNPTSTGPTNGLSADENQPTTTDSQSPATEKVTPLSEIMAQMDDQTQRMFIENITLIVIVGIVVGAAVKILKMIFIFR